MGLIPDTVPNDVGPLSNITPFTYRDGATYIEILEALREWLTDYLVPTINGQINSIVDGVNEQNSDLVEQINAEIEAINTTIAGLNTRLGAIEGYNLDNRVGTLEGYDLNTRIVEIESQNLDSRLHVAEVRNDVGAIYVGHETIPRISQVSSGLNMGGGFMRGAAFTARRSEEITQLVATSGNAIPTGLSSAVMGIYSVNGRELTLLGITEDKGASGFTSTFQQSTFNLLNPVSVVAGARYLIGLIIQVTSGQLMLMGTLINVSANNEMEPVMGMVVSPSNVFPSYVANAQVSGQIPYFVALP